MLAIPGYQIGATIHNGEKSVVYKAKRLVDNLPVVIKVLNQEYPRPEEIARFTVEYEIAKSLDIPGVVKPFALERVENSPVIIMEDFDGQPLGNLVGTDLSLAEFLRVAVELSYILGEIHSQHVIHKDINPSNILINPQNGQVKVIDFGISTALAHEEVAAGNLAGLEGTMAYISPEQTGRMNRSLDYRTDLYSLGATFYELLTNYLPFTVTDPLELVHCHIARLPLPPAQAKMGTPTILSNIIMKLLAKNAEDRYQSAYGLKVDLEECLRQWQISQKIEPFTIGQSDFSERFQIPQKLYGREAEITALLEAFDKSSKGETSLALVLGEAGAGKSSLIQELQKPIVHQRGYFITGKFDQFKRNIPYDSLIQAIRDLIRQLLTESEERITHWRTNLQKAFGSNGQVLIQVIPEIELIVGSQPDLAELNPTEAQNRFNKVFQDFIQVFARPEHPLVMFLDDLQWADSATLKLLLPLISEHSTNSLLLIGAYRLNEVNTAHPLSLTLNEIEKNYAVMKLMLKPLTESSVAQLLSDTLKTTPTQVIPFTDLILKKTAGNAFFVNQFLQSLYKEGLLHYNRSLACWQWDVIQIQNVQITDNVVELMANKLQKLPALSQEIIKLAACIGSQFELNLLAKINQTSRIETAQALWTALEEELIVPIGGAYKFIADSEESTTPVFYRFLHDRVQQAAYSLLNEQTREQNHLLIGQYLRATIAPESIDEHIFDIVNHLNLSIVLLTGSAEQTEVAGLNLLAAQKAKAAIAYEPALRYASIGLVLFDESAWDTYYELMLPLQKLQAECAYLTGDFTTAEYGFEIALEKACTNLEKAEIYVSRVALYTTQGLYNEAVQMGREGLQLLGIDLPNIDEKVDVVPEMILAQQNLRGRSVTDLLEGPTMTNPEKALATLLMERINGPLYFLNQELFVLDVMKMVNISLVYANSIYSPFVYSAYGAILAIALAEYDTGYQFVEMALQLADRLNTNVLRHRIIHFMGTFVNHWRKHINLSIDWLRQGFEVSNENGDLIIAGYCGNVVIYYRSLAGHYLPEVLSESAVYFEYLQRTKDFITADNVIVSQRAILSLQGQTESSTSFGSADFNEAEYVTHLQELAMKLPLVWYYILKLRSYYLYEEYDKALEMVQAAQPLLPYAAGLFMIPEEVFYHSLTLAALYSQTDLENQPPMWEALTAMQVQMRKWADNASANFEHKYLLVAAEMARISNQPFEAMSLYDQAIEASRDGGFIQHEALANELAGRFFLAQDKDKIARIYLLEAHYLYLTWGATAKAQALEATYAQLVNWNTSAQVDNNGKKTGNRSTVRITSSSSTATSLNNTNSLDIVTVTRAAQALSIEIKLDKLLKTLMRIVIENAGADRGFLILAENGRLQIKAEGAINESEVIVAQAVAVEDSSEVAVAIVNYVARTQEDVVLNDATCEGMFTSDPYILQKQPRSVLCVPITNQGRMVGLLYLENRLSSGAFTSQRLSILRVLAAQGAISIENAQLYNTLEQKVEQRTNELAQANQKISALNQRLQADNLRMSAELDVTRRLQQMVLPHEEELEQLPELEIAAFMQPAAEVGGDYYDVLRHPDGSLKVSIGDVTGHGLESGVIMLMVQTAMRTLVDNNQAELVEIIPAINRTLYKNIERMGSDKNMTLLLLDYQPNTGRLRLVGQHEEMLVVRNAANSQEARIEIVDTMPLGFPVGLIDEINGYMGMTECLLEQGDSIVLYTDGITEAEDKAKSQYGQTRLLKVIRQQTNANAAQIKTAIIADVLEFMGPEQPLADDITLVVLQRRPTIA
jgi:predicted ATPase/serine phosphatase RsbU (regulator of sigma subunit)/tRNA A-37 threonylcarbamoyl transferase component Bud32